MDSTINKVAAQAKTEIKDVSNIADRLATAVGKDVRNISDSASRTAGTLAESLATEIRNRPVSSSIAALAIGLVTGLLLHRSNSRR